MEAKDRNPLLRITDMHVSYGGIRALKGISLDVYEGETIAVVGANGAGKSTLLQAILGIRRIVRGSIDFLGQRIDGFPVEKNVRLGIVLVPEGRGILGQMTGVENLEMGGYLRHDPGEVKQDIERMFVMFPSLGRRRGQLVGTMSGGEQQMLAIARALMARPKLLMLDEPSLGLAPLIVTQIFHTISELRVRGTTILLVDQSAFKTLRVADRGYVLETGNVLVQDTAQNLLRNKLVKRAYLGNDAASTF